MRTANPKYIGALAIGFAGAAFLAFIPMGRAQTSVAQLAAAQAATAVSVAASVSPPVLPSAAVRPGGGMNLSRPSGVPVAVQPIVLKQPQEVTEAQALLSPDDMLGEIEIGEDTKSPRQVRNLVKKLEGDKVDLSLEDMNQARAALARLDLLLALEQKLVDLDKIRSKREAGADLDDVSAMMPGSVRGRGGSRFAMPPVDLPPPPVMPVAIRMPTVDYTVQQIDGLDGSYSAVLTASNDSKNHTVRTGDTLPDGAEVISITTTAVRLRMADEKTERTIRINNAGAVSDGRRAP